MYGSDKRAAVRAAVASYGWRTSRGTCIIAYGAVRAAATRWTICCCCTPTVTDRFTRLLTGRAASRERRLPRLEPDEVKVSRPVLRGRERREPLLLPDQM